MYITHDDYKALGYTVVPDSEFDRYNVRAEALVRKVTQNRIATMTPSEEADTDAARIVDLNRRGVCELIDLMWLADNPQSDAAAARQVVTSFSNQEYSERYLGSDRGDAAAASTGQNGINDVLNLYFTPQQLWRAVNRGGALR